MGTFIDAQPEEPIDKHSNLYSTKESYAAPLQEESNTRSRSRFQLRPPTPPLMNGRSDTKPSTLPSRELNPRYTGRLSPPRRYTSYYSGSRGSTDSHWSSISSFRSSAASQSDFHFPSSRTGSYSATVSSLTSSESYIRGAYPPSVYTPPSSYTLSSYTPSTYTHSSNAAPAAPAEAAIHGEWSKERREWARQQEILDEGSTYGDEQDEEEYYSEENRRERRRRRRREREEREKREQEKLDQEKQAQETQEQETQGQETQGQEIRKRTSRESLWSLVEAEELDLDRRRTRADS